MKILFAAAVLLIAAVYYAYTPDRSRAYLETKYGVGPDDYVEAAGIRLRVKISGPAGAPVLILLHGFGASLETWEPWAETLSQTYRVVRFDLPGFGLTGPDPGNDYSDRRMVQILVALMDALKIQKAVLIGNSLGGKIAWNFAVAEPTRVAKLALISPDGFASPGFEYGKPAQLPWVMQLLPYTMPKPMLRMNLAVAYADPKKLSNVVLTRYDDMMRAPGDRAAMLSRMAQVMLVPPGNLLKRITVPCLIIWGEQDRMIPFANAQDYVRDIPHATLVALPGLGHVPFEEAPAVALAPLQAFLDEAD